MAWRVLQWQLVLQVQAWAQGLVLLQVLVQAWMPSSEVQAPALAGELVWALEEVVELWL